MAPPQRIPADWIFEDDQVINSPSRRAGMDAKEEMDSIRRGIKIMITVGTDLGLKMNSTSAAACVYFHRFYMLHSIHEFPFPATAISCLFLAGKSEETPKKCRDVGTSAIKCFKEYYGGQSLTQIMDDIMGMERVILQTIKFDFSIDLPYKYIVNYANNFKKKFPTIDIADLVRCAWTLVNDSYYTHLSLQWEPQIIAVSLFWLAIKLRQHDQINDTKWWEDHVAELAEDKIEGICHEVLDYYSLMNLNGAGAAT